MPQSRTQLLGSGQKSAIKHVKATKIDIHCGVLSPNGSINNLATAMSNRVPSFFVEISEQQSYLPAVLRALDTCF